MQLDALPIFKVSRIGGWFCCLTVATPVLSLLAVPIFKPDYFIANLWPFILGSIVVIGVFGWAFWQVWVQCSVKIYADRVTSNSILGPKSVLWEAADVYPDGMFYFVEDASNAIKINPMLFEQKQMLYEYLYGKMKLDRHRGDRAIPHE